MLDVVVPELVVVSIRSPHKSKGRPLPKAGASSSETFQSAPLTKARGDSQKGALITMQEGFNPLPSQKQGETWFCCCFSLLCFVSIRSPHKSKGRHHRPAPSKLSRSCFNPLPSQKQGETPDCGDSPAMVSRFQSAPLTKARGDSPQSTGRTSASCFNPLPSQKQGETGHVFKR